MDGFSEGAPTTAVLALKPLRQAKSRLRIPDPLRHRLAWTMAVDTLTALTAVLDRTIVIGGQPDLAAALTAAGVAVDVLPEPPTGGMNTALRHGAEVAAMDGAATVLACVGDLPALRAGSVRAVLKAAQPFARSFLADHAGTGTTMLMARGVDLEPRFGPGSARAHRASGAVQIGDRAGEEMIDGAVHDVDTEADLEVARTIGLGRATAQLLDPRTARLADYLPITVADVGSAVTADGRRLGLDPAVCDLGGGDLHPGLRLHAVVSGSDVLSAWPSLPDLK